MSSVVSPEKTETTSGDGISKRTIGAIALVGVAAAGAGGYIGYRIGYDRGDNDGQATQHHNVLQVVPDSRTLVPQVRTYPKIMNATAIELHPDEGYTITFRATTPTRDGSPGWGLTCEVPYTEGNKATDKAATIDWPAIDCDAALGKQINITPAPTPAGK